MRNGQNWNAKEKVPFSGGTFEITRSELMRNIFAAAQEIRWLKNSSPGDRTPSAVLGSVTLYCLAMGVCGAEEIVERSKQDAAVRYLCAGFKLDWETVHHFRKRSIEELKEALEALFVSIQPARPGLEQLAQREAAERLRRAVQSDSIALDI
jgi:hypothetical protein